MYKHKIKLLYIEENLFCTQKVLLNFRFTLPLPELDIVGSRPVSNGLNFSDDIPVDIRLVTFLFLSNIRQLSTGAKTRKFW